VFTLTVTPPLSRRATSTGIEPERAGYAKCDAENWDNRAGERPPIGNDPSRSIFERSRGPVGSPFGVFHYLSGGGSVAGLALKRPDDGDRC
jgi:hypothetical protein